MDKVPSGSIGAWIAARCVMDQSGRIRVAEAYQSYCQDTGLPEWPDIRGISRNRFSRLVRAECGSSVAVTHSNGAWLVGMRWKPISQDDCI